MSHSKTSRQVWLSLGGGLDSAAMLLEAIDRGEHFDGVIFADVGDPGRLDPGEWDSTYRHVRDHIIPIVEAIGAEFVWLDTDMSPIRGERSLFRYFELSKSMPTRQSRLCTSAAKVERIQAYLDARFPAGVLEVWIGFEAGEEARAAKDPHAKGVGVGRRLNRFPLIEWGLCRCRCEAKLVEWGIPVPRKSACVFCPFSTRGDFARLRAERPETFARVAAMEENCKLTKSGKQLRYGYDRGDGSDPDLATWTDYGQRKGADGEWKGAAVKRLSLQTLSPYTRQAKPCDHCGAPLRATKATGCDYVADSEMVNAPRKGAA